MIQNLLNMEVNIYNVIWADDECATLKQDELIRKVFNEKRIEVLEYVPTSTALRNALETYKDEVDAVVVDGNFSKEDVDYLESDDISGLIHTVSFLELYNTKRDIPFFLYTARKILLQDICKNRELDYFTTTIIRKSKFPQNPKRSVRFSGKRTKRSVQKRKARNTQKAETKVL